VEVTSSTLNDNAAGEDGGGIRNRGTLEVTNSTISGNSASDGGGVFSNGLTMTLANTIVASSTGGDYAGTAPTIQGSTIVADGSVTGVNVINADPNLTPLQNNGGPTLTHLPLAGSPAINSGDNNVATDAGLTTDQRGLSRIVGSSVDIGAVEVQTDVTSDIELNFTTGAPGSVFVLTVPNLPAGSNAAISIRTPGENDFVPLITLQVAQDGTLVVVLLTDPGDPVGTYTIRVVVQTGEPSVAQAEIVRTISFDLDTAAPLRTDRPDDVPSVQLQAGGETIYLPLIRN
jgi:hypothetical protein